LFSAPSIPESPNVTKLDNNVYRLEWNKPNLAATLAKVLISLKYKIQHSGTVATDEKEIVVGKDTRSRTRRDVVKFDWKAVVKDYGSKRVLDIMDLFPNTVYKVSIKEGFDFKGELFWSAATSAEIVTPEGGKIIYRGMCLLRSYCILQPCCILMSCMVCMKRTTGNHKILYNQYNETMHVATFLVQLIEDLYRYDNEALIFETK
jgi:hypothetical protein